MTVDSFYYPVVYDNDGGIEYTFELESVGNVAMQIYKNDGTTRTLLTEGDHYSLDFEEHLDPIFTRGTVTLAAPIAPGAWLEIFRYTPRSTLYEATAQEPFLVEQFEYALDKVCYIQQELEGILCACPQYPELPEEPEQPPVEPPPPPTIVCDEYACDAIAAAATLYNLNHFPMLDPSYSPVFVPEYLEKVGAGLFEMKPTTIDDKWGTYGLGAIALDPTGSDPDSTFCAGTFGIKNTYNSGAPASWPGIDQIPHSINYTSDLGVSMPQINWNMEGSFVSRSVSAPTEWESTHNRYFSARANFKYQSGEALGINNYSWHTRLCAQKYDYGQGDGMQDTWLLSVGAYPRPKWQALLRMPVGTHQKKQYVHFKAHHTNMWYEFYQTHFSGRTIWQVYMDIYYSVKVTLQDGTVYEVDTTHSAPMMLLYSASAVAPEVFPTINTDSGAGLRMTWLTVPRTYESMYALTLNDGINKLDPSVWAAMEQAWKENNADFETNCYPI